MTEHKPLLIIIAGPNGSGKTTKMVNKVRMVTMSPYPKSSQDTLNQYTTSAQLQNMWIEYTFTITHKTEKLQKSYSASPMAKLQNNMQPICQSGPSELRRISSL